MVGPSLDSRVLLEIVSTIVAQIMVGRGLKAHHAIFGIVQVRELSGTCGEG